MQFTSFSTPTQLLSFVDENRTKKYVLDIIQMLLGLAEALSASQGGEEEREGVFYRMMHLFFCLLLSCLVEALWLFFTSCALFWAVRAAGPCPADNCAGAADMLVLLFLLKLEEDTTMDFLFSVLICRTSSSKACWTLSPDRAEVST